MQFLHLLTISFLQFKTLGCGLACFKRYLLGCSTFVTQFISLVMLNFNLCPTSQFIIYKRLWQVCRVNCMMQHLFKKACTTNCTVKKDTSLLSCYSCLQQAPDISKLPLEVILCTHKSFGNMSFSAVKYSNPSGVKIGKSLTTL